MKTHIAYCSACDRDVRIVVTDEPSHDGQATIRDAEVICLEIGEHCTGSFCPVSAEPPAAMAVRLVRNGLQQVMHPILRVQCGGCGRETSYVVVGEMGTCEECGTAARYRELELAPRA